MQNTRNVTDWLAYLSSDGPLKWKITEFSIDISLNISLHFTIGFYRQDVLEFKIITTRA